MISRNWTRDGDCEKPEGCTCEEGGDFCLVCEVLNERLDELAAEWSHIMTEIEHRSFTRDDDREGEYADYLSEMEEDEQERFLQRKKKRDLVERLRIDSIENELASYGARMMRPYEHWNEEERQMEWLETRYDYDDRY